MRNVLAALIALGTPMAASAQQSANPIVPLVGEWDRPNEGINILIQRDHVVRHSKLGSGDIQHDNANYFTIRYRDRYLTCRYEVGVYSKTRVVFRTIMRPAPDDCELGEMERTLKKPSRLQDTGPAPDGNNRPEGPTAALSTFTDCQDCPVMVVVPAGAFEMGSHEAERGRLRFEGPVRRVTFKKSFAAGRDAVTREQFMVFVQDTNYAYGRTCFADSERGPVDLPNHSVLAPPGFAQEGRHPAVCVNWKDAVAYTKWLSARTGHTYRLLSEAEREYITRAGTGTAYWWGPLPDPNKANYDKRPRLAPASPAQGPKPKASAPAPLSQVSPGGTFPVDWGGPNPWGFFQVHGNVAEWTQDCWNEDYRSATEDGSARNAGDCVYRVTRGGAWSSWPEDIRAAYRGKANADYRFSSIGFRIARDLPDDQ